MRAIDLTGKRVGRWTVIKRAENSASGGTMWRCRCECGTVRVVNGIVLRDARSQSCGCLRSDVTIARSTKHGHSPSRQQPTPTYHSWVGMTQRCTNPKNRHFADYGGRGIVVCKRWRSFANFLADMGVKPTRTSLDRIDNGKGYSPRNCRWSTPVSQGRNKRSNRVIEWGGQRKTLGEWASELGMTHSSLQERLAKWPLARAMTPR